MIKVPGTVPLYHWYVGVPPWLVAAAVNVTFEPGQIAVAGLAVTLTAGTTFGFTTIVLLAVAVLGFAQPRSLVNTTVITSLFTRLLLE